jgi:integrase
MPNLSWDEIDLAGRVWNLPRERCKNDHAHSVPLAAEALTILESLQIGIGKAPLFEAQSFSRMKEAIDKLLPAGFPAWCLHDLRRTMASGCARLGVQPHVIESCLNHRSGVIKGVASVYNRYSYASEKREALALWGEYVAGLVSLSKAA